MSYVNPNYKTKKEFVAAVKAGIEHYTYNPSGLYAPNENGRDVIEGPHYPKPHRWYVCVHVENGIVTKVLS